MKFLLILSMLSPITELFPSMNLTWWPFEDKMGVIPSEYHKMRSMRVFAALLIWLPILAHINSVGLFSRSTFRILVVMMFCALYLRTQEYRDGRISDRSFIPGLLYSLSLLLIAMVYSTKKSVGLLLAGAYLISKYRNPPSYYDWVGRILYAGGFTSFLYYL